SRDYLVRFFRLINREPMRVERLQVELPLGKKLKKTLHVARFGPTDVPNRIVASFLLVRRIVTARPVGTRNSEIELFLVVALAFQFHAHGAHGDDHSAIARYLRRPVDRFTARGFSGDEHGVHTEPVSLL